MKYQFSFSDKQELIFINAKPFEAKIGALIASVIVHIAILAGQQGRNSRPRRAAIPGQAGS